MFDFEKLNVYQEATILSNGLIKFIIDTKGIDLYIKDQLKRASLSIVLNIAEGAGRYTKADKKNFYIIARGSVYEVVSILQIMKNLLILPNDLYDKYYLNCENISKMLIGMINNLTK